MKLSEAIKNAGVSAIIYGESGIGKTHFIGTLPGKTLIIAVEPNGILTLNKFPDEVKSRVEVEFLPPVIDNDIARTSDNYNKFFDQLAVKKLECNNLVLDSASELGNTLLINRTDINKNGGAPTQQNYGQVISVMRRYLRIFRDIAINKGINVVILALEAEMILNQYGENVNSKIHPALSGKKLPSEAEGLFDIVGHMEKTSAGERYIRLESNENFMAKDRVWGRKACLADGKILFSGKKGNEEK